MIATDNNVQNPNQLSNINIKFWIKRSPTISYFVYKANIPGLTLPEVPYPTPFVEIPQTGDHLQFHDFQVTFKVDEDMRNWLEIHQWMRDLAGADSKLGYKRLEQNPQYTGLGLKSELVLTVANSSRNVNLVFTFYDATPNYLSDIDFDGQSRDIETISATVRFQYINYDYMRISDGDQIPLDTNS